jgi:hypothetical protein
MGVLASAYWITKVACLLLRNLLPSGGLTDTRETSWHIVIEAWGFDVVLGSSAERRDYCNPTMRNLSGAKVTPANLIALH